MSFDTLAPYYRAMETVSAGNVQQRCRTSFLSETIGCRRALLLGEGPGRFLVELLRANPHVEVTCVERSARMIQEALSHVKHQGLDTARITVEQQDVLTWRPLVGAFDLVSTHFFLDCFRRDELEGVVTKVGVSATSEARWLLADFRVPERGWRRWRARGILALLYGFFRVTTGLSASQLTPPDDLLRAAGFRLAQRRLANSGLVHSDLWFKTNP